MVKIEVGTIVPKASIKSGEKDGKPWLFGTVENGYDKVQVWATNAGQFSADSDFGIDEIAGVSVRNEKYLAKDGSERWAKKTVINAKLSPIADVMPAPSKPSPVTGFAQITDEDIPF